MKHYTGSELVDIYAGNETTNDHISNSSSAGLMTYSGPWGEKQVMHLLRRCLFGFSLADYRYFSKMTLQECLDILLTPSAAPSPPVNAYNDKDYTDPDVPAGQTWINASFGTGSTDLYRMENCFAWWFGHILNQERTLTEKMTLFWQDHFATEASVVKDARKSYRFNALLRKHSLGNFKVLTRAVTTEPNMLVYLNGDTNTKNAPNENYARELQELFTLGKGPGSHYTEDDVRAAARVLTGWKDNFETVSAYFNPADHDISDKQFSAFFDLTVIKGQQGDKGAKETDQLIDMIFSRQETARYTCRNLYRWFVFYLIDDQVEKNVIIPLADELVKNNFEVAPVLRRLLASEHFFDPLNRGAQVKNPIDFFAGMCKQFNPAFPPSTDLFLLYQTWRCISEEFRLLGMDISQPPSVAGWPAYYQEPEYDQLWINSGTIQLRNIIAESLFSKMGLEIKPNDKDVDGWILRVDVLAFADRLNNPSDAGSLIDDSIDVLMANPIDAEQKTYLKSILLTGQLSEHYWRDAWEKYKAKPEDEQLKSIVESRLRTLYTYMTGMMEYQLI